MPKLDITGQRFGRLVAISPTDKRINGSVVWTCKCDCGNECDISIKNLRMGRTNSCGCLKKESDKKPKGNVIDETGKKYGHLTVLERVGSDKYGQATWLCECDCELHTKIVVLGGNLRKGHTTSCGCDRSSKGEKRIANILLDNKIIFSTQYRFKELQNLSFDFAIYDEDNKLKYLIEYDGETHYNYNLHGWHTKDRLEQQLKRDKIKNDYCLSNNIPLIRIPYYHYKDLKIKDLLLETTTFLVKGE